MTRRWESSQGASTGWWVEINCALWVSELGRSSDGIQNLLRESEYLQLSDRLSLPDLVERYPGRRGVRKVRAALERLKEEPGGRKRAPLEERFAPFLRRHHLFLPRFNELDGWEAIASDLRVLLRA